MLFLEIGDRSQTSNKNEMYTLKYIDSKSSFCQINFIFLDILQGRRFCKFLCRT